MRRTLLALTVALLSSPAAAADAPVSYSNNFLNCNAPIGYHLTEADMTCPVGGEKFKALQLGTHSTFGIYLDLRPVSYLGLPAPLAVCPSNGMVVSQDKYSDDELEKIGKAIATDEYKKIYAGQQATFFLLAEQERLSGTGTGPRWQKLMPATWEADVCQDSGKYKTYATMALEELKKAFKDMKPKDDYYWTVGLLIPELNRRLGDFDAARDALLDLGGDLPADAQQKEATALIIDLLKAAISRRDTGPVQMKKDK
jgi:hypothetical protein